MKPLNFEVSFADFFLYNNLALIRPRCLKRDYVQSRIIEGNFEPFFAKVSAVHCQSLRCGQRPVRNYVTCGMSVEHVQSILEGDEQVTLIWVEGSKTNRRAGEGPEKETSPMSFAQDKGQGLRAGVRERKKFRVMNSGP